MVFGLIVLVALSHVPPAVVAVADEEIVYIERRDGSLITYGYETFYITSDKSEVKYRINVPERETNVNLCLRLGKSVEDCRNSIQFVKREKNSIIACGTDATIRTCYIINEAGRVQRTFPAHDLVSVKPADWPHWTSVSGTDKIVVVSADQESKFGMHLMRLTGSEAQNDKSFKFGDDHDFYSIVQHDDRVVLFGSRQIGDVKRGYIYQMCHNDPGTKESGNSFSQIAKIDLECAHKGQVYRHFVSTQTLNSTNTLGLFAHEYNQDTVLCIINEQSLNKLNFNCSKESNAGENEVTRVIELSLTEEAIYVGQNVKHVTAMPDWSLFLHSHTTLKKTILQTADVYNNTVGASTPKLQLYNSFESSHALIDVDSVVGWGTELVYLRDGIIGRVQPEQCPYATCVSCMASHDYCDFQGQSCRGSGGGGDGDDGELTCPAPTEERYTKNVEHGTALVLEFDKVKHNITSEQLRIYDELIWYRGRQAINTTTPASDFVMSETNQRAALIIFNPSEQVSQTFTLNVMLNQIVIYTVVYTLALAQARSEAPSTTEISATTPPIIVDQASTFGNPVIILLLIIVGVLLAIVGALCIRVRRRNIDHEHEKTPMIKSQKMAIIVLPGGETKTVDCSDVIHVSGITSRDDFVQSRLREAINKMN